MEVDRYIFTDAIIKFVTDYEQKINKGSQQYRWPNFSKQNSNILSYSWFNFKHSV